MVSRISSMNSTVPPKFKKKAPILPLLHYPPTKKTYKEGRIHQLQRYVRLSCAALLYTSWRGTCQNIICKIMMWNMWWENHIETSKQPIQNTLTSTVPIFVSHPFSRLVKNNPPPQQKQRLTKDIPKNVGFGVRGRPPPCFQMTWQL